MSIIVITRLASGTVKIEKDDNPRYFSGGSWIVDPSTDDEILYISHSSGFNLSVKDGDTLTANGNSINIETGADAIAEVLATSIFFLAKEPSNFLLGLQALGSAFKAQTLGMDFPNITTSANMSDGQILYIAVYLPKGASITGIAFYQVIQGVFTADNSNVVALYSYDGAGTATKVAESANDGNIFKGAANTYQKVAFASPYAAQAGIYFVALLCNSSASSTTATIGAGANASNVAVHAADFTNSAFIVGFRTGQASLPATQALSGVTGLVNRPWVGLY